MDPTRSSRDDGREPIAIDRRSVCRGAIAAGVSMAGVKPASAQKEVGDGGPKPARFAYTGCRTTKERNARGEGINVFRLDASSGSWQHVQLQKTSVPNPSYLAFDRSRRVLYAVHGDVGDVSAYAVDGETGKITPINQQSTGGRNPVHMLADTTNKRHVLQVTDGLFWREVKAVAAGHPEIRLREIDVDAMAADIYTRPGDFDVILTSNMFGDILSNLANALGLILSAAALLRWHGARDSSNAFEIASRRIEDSVDRVVTDPRSRTGDLGGSATTREVSESICQAIGQT